MAPVFYLQVNSDASKFIDDDNNNNNNNNNNKISLVEL
jgi:hypothetical protein